MRWGGMDATIPGVILDCSSARNNYVSAPAAFVGAATGNAFIALAPARALFRPISAAGGGSDDHVTTRATRRVMRLISGTK